MLRDAQRVRRQNAIIPDKGQGRSRYVGNGFNESSLTVAEGTVKLSVQWTTPNLSIAADQFQMPA
jgi:hypothetical protein